MSLIQILVVFCYCVAAVFYSANANAEKQTRSRLLVTSGASSIEGTAGGGIVPMAILSGYGAQEEQGGTGFVSHVDTGDYQLDVLGASWSWHNRIEISYAEQELTHDALTKALNLPTDSIRQHIWGVKVRMLGDLIYTRVPQLSIGAQYKKNIDFLVPSAVGAEKDSGTDINLTASKLLLGAAFGYNLLLNTNVRYTDANQSGLVGFGGDKNDSKKLMPEFSIAILPDKHWLIGGEYRSKPDNLSAVKEDDWRTLFVGWFPTKRVALVAAYVDLGEVATFKNQHGWYLSLQGSF